MSDLKEYFLSVCDELKKEILQDLSDKKLPSEALEWVDEMIEYNCKGGKLNRGISVIQCSEVLFESKNHLIFTEEQKKKAAVLGWCIEWLQASFLVADDVMDASITRRGKPCWYRNPKVQMIAFNDAFLLESFVFQILKKHFKSEVYYSKLVELFREVIYLTEIGQLLDLTSQPLDGAIDLLRFTPERYHQIVVFKTAYYTFFLSAACALHLSGEQNDLCFEKTKEVCVKIGEFFQIQDDFLDCYGDEKLIGKIGTDIQDSKCCWLIVQALKLSNEAQRQVLLLNYGKDNQDSITAVKGVYNELRLNEVYKIFEETSYTEIRSLIDETNELPKELFLMLLQKIYKRDK